MLASLRGGDGEMRAAVRASCLIAAIGISPAFAQTATLLEKFKDWSAYTNGTPKVCFAVAQPKTSNPPKAKRGPIFFYISRWPADHVDGEISVKMGYPFKEGAKVTLTAGAEKFELFTKEEGAFVDKPDQEAKLVEALKKGGKMKIEGTSMKGTKTSDEYSLDGAAEALERMAKECAG
jgi:Invasion associated locus B (IalB) protein